MIGDYLEDFYELPVKEFASEDDWAGADVAYRLRVETDSEATLEAQLDILAGMPDANQLTAIVIGNWCGGDDSLISSQTVVDKLVASTAAFSDLRAIFLGDIVYEENEISWINQCDLAPILQAYPLLEMLCIRGGSELALTTCKHANLKQLTIETGGLPRSVVRNISQSDFPKLEVLELWLGTAAYGCDTTIEDLQTILSGTIFPALKYLGIRNTDDIDSLIPIIVNSPILNRLVTLDLSLGNMTDVGAQSLLQLASNSSLKNLDVRHHYMTDLMMEKLKSAIPFNLAMDESEGADEEWRSIVCSE